MLTFSGVVSIWMIQKKALSFLLPFDGENIHLRLWETR